MDDKQLLLDRYYQAFINLNHTRDFFIGLADYVDYADSVPEFYRLTKEISKQGQPLLDKLNELEPKAAARLDEVKAKIEAYVAEHKIEDERIKEAFAQYYSFRQGKSSSSSGMPNALHHHLYDILEVMRGMPEHREFFSKYATYFDRDNMVVRSLLDLSELNEYDEAQIAIETARKTTLWGELNEIAQLYQIIKRGPELWQKAKEAFQKTSATSDYLSALNYSFVLGEWQKIEREDRLSQIYFFDVKKVRPWVERLHNYILSRSMLGPIASESEKAIANLSIPAPPRLNPRIIVEGKQGYLQLSRQTKKYPIAGIATRQFQLVRCLFNPEGSVDEAYNPMPQKYDRVFGTVRLAKDNQNGKLKSEMTARKEMQAIIEQTIDELQKKAIGKCLRFERLEYETYRLEITLPQGKPRGK